MCFTVSHLILSKGKEARTYDWWACVCVSPPPERGSEDIESRYLLTWCAHNEQQQDLRSAPLAKQFIKAFFFHPPSALLLRSSHPVVCHNSYFKKEKSSDMSAHTRTAGNNNPSSFFSHFLSRTLMPVHNTDCYTVCIFLVSWCLFPAIWVAKIFWAANTVT